MIAMTLHSIGMTLLWLAGIPFVVVIHELIRRNTTQRGSK